MENTLKIMELIINEVKENLRFNPQASKTLMNTYQTLLRRTYDLTHNTKNIREYIKILNAQKDELINVGKITEKEIFTHLQLSKYKEADCLAIIGDRINTCINNIYSLSNRIDKNLKKQIVNLMDNKSLNNKDN